MPGTRTDVFEAILADLRTEGDELESIVGSSTVDWTRPTPAAGWTIAHQIGHLATSDELSVLSCTAPTDFDERAREAVLDQPVFIERGAATGALSAPGDLLVRWSLGRRALLDVFAGREPESLMHWFRRPMRLQTMATARLMETWAHGLDIADSLSIRRRPTQRLRHIADLGVRTRNFAFRANGLEPPADPFRISLGAPDGTPWAWGPVDARQQVSGPAEDFCLLVTRRRHRDDLALRFVGRQADQWLDLAQAFAGPPGPGRERSDDHPRPAG